MIIILHIRVNSIWAIKSILVCLVPLSKVNFDWWSYDKSVKGVLRTRKAGITALILSMIFLQCCNWLFILCLTKLFAKTDVFNSFCSFAVHWIEKGLLNVLTPFYVKQIIYYCRLKIESFKLLLVLSQCQPPSSFKLFQAHYGCLIRIMPCDRSLK